MKTYKDFSREYNRLIDEYWGLLHERNDLYKLIEGMLEAIREKEGMSRAEAEKIWDEILEEKQEG